MSNKEEIPWTWGDGGQPPSPPPEARAGQRFLACGYDAEMKPFADGNWISYNDYSKLLHERIHDLNQIGGLQAENARLRSEVERLKEGNECLDQMHEKEMARSAFLCEEVNRTTAWGRGLESDLSHAMVEISFLKAEVERLTKAGDAMDAYLKHQDGTTNGMLDCRLQWFAAKEGKQS
jgi:uncharacterized small protein (DUF1192 family)